MGKINDSPGFSDVFAIIPPSTSCGSVIFGKNSFRPVEEIQEVVYFKGEECESDEVKCTLITIPQVKTTNSIIISRPPSVWGAEMGANDKGVCIGNSIVLTRTLNAPKACIDKNKLTGADLVRLGLERGIDAKEAMDIIINLIENYGQGGSCGPECEPNPYAHSNSFIICDKNSAWLLETIDIHWAAKRIENFINIHRTLKIGNDMEAMSEGLKAVAASMDLWNEGDDFNMMNIFGHHNDITDESVRHEKIFSDHFGSDSLITFTDMMKLMRCKEACRAEGDYFIQSSQISRPSLDDITVHWFTATPDPSASVFKPFVFTDNVTISKHTKCSEIGLPHKLFLQKNNKTLSTEVIEALREMEHNCVDELNGVQIESPEGQELLSSSELNDIMRDCIEAEMSFYH